MSQPIENELGVKWTQDHSLTDWCKRADHHGISLPNHRVWKVETPEGRRTRLLCDGQDIIYESPRMEDMAAKIDVLKLQKHYAIKEALK